MVQDRNVFGENQVHSAELWATARVEDGDGRDTRRVTATDNLEECQQTQEVMWEMGHSPRERVDA